MGKVRRQRNKLHLAASKLPNKDEKWKSSSPEVFEEPIVPSVLPIAPPKGNIFAGLSMDIDSILKPSLSSATNLDNDDTKSVKSTKSSKSNKSQANPMSKKDKLKLRREALLKKIDTVNQMKKDLKVRQRRKNTPILGDSNPLFDALPMLDLLTKDKSDSKTVKNKNQKKKAIAKASRRKRDLVQGVDMFKTILNDKEFKKNPLEAITKQIQVRFSKPTQSNVGSKKIIK